MRTTIVAALAMMWAAVAGAQTAPPPPPGTPFSVATYPSTHLPGEEFSIVFEVLKSDVALMPIAHVKVDGTELSVQMPLTCATPAPAGFFQTCYISPAPDAVAQAVDAPGRHEIIVQISIVGVDGTTHLSQFEGPFVIYTLASDCIYVLNGVTTHRPIGYPITGTIPFTKNGDINYGVNRLAELRAEGWRVDPFLLNPDTMKVVMKCTALPQ